MPYCEDYPCCGHGPPPMGDGGGCPDSQGCFRCVLCGSTLPKGATTSIGECCRHRVGYDYEFGERDVPAFDEGGYQ